MKAVVIDTNVLLVANGRHSDVSIECRIACITKLLACQRSGIVVIDEGFLILQEYQKRTSPNEPKGVGDEFLKWLLQNKSNRKRVHVVSISQTGDNIYAEFPDALLQAEFDVQDRKFVAVANGHPRRPSIWQATDSKWLGWRKRLAQVGVTVEFLCIEDAKKFYAQKFPKQDIDELLAD